MKRHTILAAVAIAIGVAAASCGDQPTAPGTTPDLTNTPADAAAQLPNVPVTGVLSDGGTFAGTITAQRITYDETAKTLVMTGTLTGTATTAAGVASAVTQQFTTPITLAHQASATSVFRTTSMVTCDILFLDLGPLHLDLLGLTLDLNEVVLDLNAVSGAGNLLGNLLCAVVSLLDGPGILASIGQILESINNILAGLTPPGTAGAAWILPPAAIAGPADVMRS